jgi:hypothetical protein
VGDDVGCVRSSNEFEDSSNELEDLKQSLISDGTLLRLGANVMFQSSRQRAEIFDLKLLFLSSGLGLSGLKCLTLGAEVHTSGGVLILQATFRQMALHIWLELS